MVVNLDEHEWSQVIAIIAQSHPLIAKISTQLVAQRRGNSHAAKGLSEQSDTRVDPSWLAEKVAQANRGDSSE